MYIFLHNPLSFLSWITHNETNEKNIIYNTKHNQQSSQYHGHNHQYPCATGQHVRLAYISSSCCGISLLKNKTILFYRTTKLLYQRTLVVFQYIKLCSIILKFKLLFQFCNVNHSTIIHTKIFLMLSHCMMWLCNTNVFNDTSCIDAENI